MIQAQADKANNLLRVRHTGRVTAAEARQGAEEVLEVLQALEPGFRLLTDLSGLESMELACVPALERMMDACDHCGVSLVVRLIPDPHKDIGMNIMSLFHYSPRVRIVTCATLPEAEAALKT